MRQAKLIPNAIILNIIGRIILTHISQLSVSHFTIVWLIPAKPINIPSKPIIILIPGYISALHSLFFEFDTHIPINKMKLGNIEIDSNIFVMRKKKIYILYHNKFY